MKGAEFIQDQRSYDFLSTLTEGIQWSEADREVRENDSISLIPGNLPSFRCLLEIFGHKVIPTIYSQVEHEIQERVRCFPDSVVYEANAEEIAIHFEILSLTTSLYFPFEGNWFPSIRTKSRSLEDVKIDARGAVDLIEAWMYPDTSRAEQVSMQCEYRWDRAYQTIELFEVTTHDFGKNPNHSTKQCKPSLEHLREEIEGLGGFTIPTSMSENELLTNLLFPYRVNDIDLYTGERKRTTGYEMFGIRFESCLH